MNESSKSPPPAAPQPFGVDEYAPPEFEPAQPRPRFDGWTPKRQTDFIAALRRERLAHACGVPRNSERGAGRARLFRIALASHSLAW